MLACARVTTSARARVANWLMYGELAYVWRIGIWRKGIWQNDVVSIAGNDI